MLLLLFAPFSMGCEDDSNPLQLGGPDFDSGFELPDASQTPPLPPSPSDSAPTPGTLTASNPTSSSVDLSWTAATDDVTPAAELEYRVYYSLEDNLDTVENVLANGTAASDWQKGATTLTVKSLALDMPYHFNVLVRDGAQNVAVYGGASASTLGGAWQPQETIEVAAGESAYYSRLAVNSKGDVVAYWTMTPNWDLAFAVRPHDADTFGATVHWGGVPRGQWPLHIGFHDQLYIPTLLSPEDDSHDLVLASGGMGAPPTVDPVVTGLPDYVYQARVCTSADGTAMVAWIERPGGGAQPVRARIRTASGWGTTTLVSETEERTYYDLEVVCSPDGNHLVVFEDTTADPRTLQARLYDAALGEWMPVTTLSGRYADGGYSVARTDSGKRFVAWHEFDADGSYFMVRSLEGTTWSDPVVLTSDAGSTLRIVTAGEDVHAFWRSSGAIVTRRLLAGTSAWTDEEVFDDAMDVYDVSASGSAFGDVVLAWSRGLTVSARLWSPSTKAWGATELLGEATTLIGYGSLHSLIDPRRRATVVWTEYDSHFSVRSRTYR